MKKLAAFTGAFLIALVIAAPAPAAVIRGMDAWYEVDGGMWGKDVVGDGAGQTFATPIPQGLRAQFPLMVENIGGGADHAAVAGCTGVRGIGVRYFEGDDDITQLILSGAYGTPELGAGYVYDELRVQLRVRRNAVIGTRFLCLTTVRSLDAPENTDTVRLRIKVTEAVT